MKKEEKILFRDMSMQEKKNLITLWKRVAIVDKSNHAKTKMRLLGITEKDIERAWKVNHIIEYKVIVDNGVVTDVRLLVRGLDVTMKKYEWTSDGREMKDRALCNICLVVSLKRKTLITCYASPSGVHRYRNSNGRTDKAYEQKMNDNLRKNLMMLVSSY